MTILLASAGHAEFAPMLAARLRQCGCTVEALCAPHDLLAFSNAISRRHHLPCTRSLASLRRAIEASRPGLIIPCDDPVRYALTALHQDCSRLRDQASREVAAVIERSLGNPAHFGMAEEKSKLLEGLGDADVLLPGTKRVQSAAELERVCGDIAFPLVLKRDRTWGGQGVVICRNEDEARRGFAKLSSPPGARDTLRSMLIDRDLAAGRRYLAPPAPVIAAQAYIAGRPANRAVVCSDGEVLAGVTVLGVEMNPHPIGPASVVQIIHNVEIERQVSLIARRLGLSGICGFDFVVEEASGKPYFLEINPRATPTCHFGRTMATDVCRAIGRHWGGGSPPQPPADERDTSQPIPVFPAEWRRDLNSPNLRSMQPDLPWSDAGVLAAITLGRALQESRRSRWMAQLGRHVVQWLLRRH